ncbi:PREDICTED: programmed cell death protein 2-like [Nicrophorus vespilloides]|uniref:Programmed cell death protein 2-like n=1 Tax=Nicrophorus vespilloides TaxID=110193 RepID=A0ABM1NIJ7_NICVS|nr:PREDICTED: programmed cell death protein 2-like [Nicrophorus vespilloides]
MAYNNISVQLGYEDELITDKYKSTVNYTTDKFGGKPDFPNDLKVESTQCPLCQLPRLLVIQIYAPLDATYHRTLYVFACLNPNCRNSNESWLCMRVQCTEQIKDIIPSTPTATSTVTATDWCQDADEWDDDNNSNFSEENGNVINENIEQVSDEDEESLSLEDSVQAGFENLYVDERNANNADVQGAVGSLHSPAATAEIEGDESEVVSIDTPTIPQRDLSLFLQEICPLSQEFFRTEKQLNIEFVPYFIRFSDKVGPGSSGYIDRHVKELLQEYQKNNEDFSMKKGGGCADGGGGGEATLEKYEKSAPAHGDKMFYYFLSKIRQNPGQILRYNRESKAPLLIQPIQHIPKVCKHCQAEMTFEMQILPTIIPRLRLNTDPVQVERLEFGNVLVFTCKKSCWSSDTQYRQEEVIFQAQM